MFTAIRRASSFVRQIGKRLAVGVADDVSQEWGRRAMVRGNGEVLLPSRSAYAFGAQGSRRLPRAGKLLPDSYLTGWRSYFGFCETPS
jgi:hypothetical protein